MSAPGPVAALVDRWWRQAARLLDESKTQDDYRRGEMKGRAKGVADCAKELEDLTKTVKST